MPVIDIHNHFFPRTWPDLAARYGTPDWPWIKHTEPGKAEIMVGDRFFRQIYSACWDPEVRLQEMDRDGVDMQVISATPVLFAYDRPVEHALDCARIVQRCGARTLRAGKGPSEIALPGATARYRRIVQRTEPLCAQLGISACRSEIMSGKRISTTPGSSLFFSTAPTKALRCWCIPGTCWDLPRMPKYMMPWTVGMPAETQLGIVAMILSGAFDKLPATLRICFAHGGGSFAFLLGPPGECLAASSGGAWGLRAAAEPISRIASPSTPPSSISVRCSFLVDTMGAERVMLGSDYPFPLGEHGIGQLIRTSHLPAASEDANAWRRTPTEFLGLEPKRRA